MNISYRSVWSHATGAWVAVSEVARGRGKQGRAGRSVRAAAHVLAAAALVLGAGAVMADTLVTQGTLDVTSSGDVTGTVVVDNTDNANATLVIHENVSIDNAVNLNNGGTLRNAGSIVRTGPDDIAVSSAGGATVDNAASGRIEGANTAVQLSGGGTVTNAGTLQGQVAGLTIEGMGTVTNSGRITSGGYGVLVASGLGTVVNQLGGVITGGSHGVSIEGGTVTNQGKIVAINVDGQGVVAGGAAAAVINTGTIQALGRGGRGVFLWSDNSDALAVTNEGSGQIMAENTGVQMNGVGTVTNSGKISATAADGLGVYFGTAKGTLVNQAGGTIAGKSVGAMLEFGGTVSNTGAGSVISASGTGSKGVFIDGGAGTVTNDAGGISGNLNGVLLWGGGSVSNTGGTISATASTSSQGVEIVGGAGTVTNQGGGTLTGKLYGVSLADGGSVTNTASTIRADGTNQSTAGVGISGGAGTVTNSGAVGLIQGTRYGVRLINGGTVTNTSGTISAAGSGGVGAEFAGGVAEVQNSAGGTIRGASLGLSISGGGNVTNSGAGSVITANGSLSSSAGIKTSGKAVTIVNEKGASIKGGENAIYLGGGGKITNTGAGSTISIGASLTSATVSIQGAGDVSNLDGAVIQGGRVGVSFASGGSLVNDVGSTIQGSNQSVVNLNGKTTLVNKGTLTGAVYLNFQDGSSTKAHDVTLFKGSLITGNLQMGRNLASTLTLDGMGSQLYSAAVTGSTTFGGDLIKQGSGTWTLDKSLTQRDTYLNAGGINVGLGSALGTGKLRMAGDTTLGFSAGNLALANDIDLNQGGGTAPIVDTGAFSETLQGVIAGAGGLVKKGSGTLTLTGTNTYTGGTSISAGTLQLGQGGTTGSLAGNVINNGTLAINRSDALTLAGNISGSGSLRQSGSGVTTLTGANTYTGSTSVNAGTLVVASNTALGMGAVSVDNGGNALANGKATLQINADVSVDKYIVIADGNTLNNAGNLTRTGLQQFGVGAAAGASINNLATGKIIGAQVGVVVQNGGMVTNAGLIDGGDASGVQATGGAATVVNTRGGTITGGSAGVILANGGTVINTGGSITATTAGYTGVYMLSGAGVVTNTDGGRMTGSGNGVWVNNGDATVTNGVGSTIEGTGSSVYVPNGSVVLSNAGTMTGHVALGTNVPNAKHEVTLFSGSRITGKLEMGTGTTSTLTLDGAGTQLYSQAVRDATLFAGTVIKQGSGTWTLDQTQNGLTTGNAQVAAGTLNVATRLNSAKVDVLGGATLSGGGTLAGAVEIANGGHLALRAGSTLKAASLVLNETSQLDVALGAPSTTGLLTLGGDLTLHGQLNVTDAGGFGRGAYRLIDYGGSLTDLGMTVGDVPLGYKSGDMAVQTGVAQQVNLVVGASSGTLRFWNGGVTQADGTVHGGDGTWNAAGSNWTTTDGSVSQAWAHDYGIFQGTGGTVTINGTQTFSGLQFADGYKLVNGSTGKLTAVNDTDGTAAIRVDRDATASIAVTIDGSATLDKRDRGTLVLSGANSYTGGTKVSGGTLMAAHNSALGSGVVTVDNTGDFGATLAVNAGITFGNEVILNNQGTLTNAGTIERPALESVGVTSQTGGATVNNLKSGLISGGTQGVQLHQGGTVNNAGGTIRSLLEGAGIETNGAAGTVNNTLGGTLSGRYAGVSMYGGGTVNNTASTISADKPASSGVYFEGADAVVNNTGGGRIEGAGTGVNINSSTATVNNGVDSIIQGSGASLNAFQGDVTLNNAGKMVGQVRLQGTGTHKVTLFTGSLIDGRLAMGTNTASTLTLDGAGSQTYSAAVTGATIFEGTLIKQGSGTWTLDQASTRSGGTSLKAGRLNLRDDQALGTGELAMDDGTTLGFAKDGLTIANAIRMTGHNDPVIDTGAFSQTLAGVISGGGFLTKEGSGTLTLSAANTYTGATNVAQGSLKAGAANTFSATSAHSVAAGATLDTNGFNQTLPALTNAGTVNLRSATGTVGNTLTVTGPYTGNNGALQVATFLGDSSSASDRLLLSGGAAIASGSTQVQVTQVGGLGALTTGNGISVIATDNGGRIDANAFNLAGGHVDAGSFEYRLTGGAQGLYLSSTEIGSGTPAVPGGPGGTPVGPAPVTLYRAEVPLLSALPEQLREANLAMLANRHQRLGDNVGMAAPAGTLQAWGRLLTVQRDIAQGGAINPESHGRLTGFQAGTDLFSGSSDAAQWQAGLYVGQLDGDMSARGFARGIANLQVGNNTLRNQYLGAYGSYQADSGLYAEVLVQAGRHRYDVNATGGTGANGRGSSLLASLEVGQSFPVAPGWRIEPQLQFVHQSLSLDELSLGGLTTVGQDTKSGWTLRAGLRVQGELSTGLGALKPYARLNFYKNANGTDTATYRTPAALTVIGTPTGGTRSELAVGAALSLNDSTSVYGEIGQLNASGGNTRTKGGVNASVGVKVRW